MEEAKQRQAQEEIGRKHAKEKPIKAWLSKLFQQDPVVKAALIGAAATILAALCNFLSGNPAPEILRSVLGRNPTSTPTLALTIAASTLTPTSTSISTPTFVLTNAPSPTSTFVLASPTPILTPTEVIPSIAKIEVLMDDSPLDLDNLPRLPGGKTVVLEIFAVDSNGTRYASDDLVCNWSVIPIGADDQDISTDLCKTFYTPSREYTVQTVAVEVQGLEQQFESSYSISLKFDITS